MSEQFLRQGEVYRYPSPASPRPESIDGLPNFYARTLTEGEKMARLERGITRLAPVPDGAGGRRTPATLVRSSPWKAGTSANPWHDTFDPDRAVAAYHGDNKIDRKLQAPRLDDPSASRGNGYLLESFWAHESDRPLERDRGGPVLVFTGVTVDGRHKGNVRFDGIGVVTGVSFIRQVDDESGLPFRNLLFELTLLDLAAEQGVLNWRWIAARRTGDDTTGLAPLAWSRWLREGRGSLERHRAQAWTVEPLSAS